jgi:Skp family chaperone for outer membrane proteins
MQQGVLEVTKSQVVAALLACLVVASLAIPPAVAQTAPRPNIAMLDINYIFKNHTRFKAAMADMKAEMERADQVLRNQRDQIQALQEELKGIKPSSPDYKVKEQNLARQMADLNIQAQAQRKEFLLKEARVYHDVYKEIQQVVGYYAAQQSFTAVLRFNGDAVDQENPDDVLRYINQDTVWFTQGLDITPVILETLNARAGMSASRTSAPMGTSPSRPAVPFQR